MENELKYEVLSMSIVPPFFTQKVVATFEDKADAETFCEEIKDRDEYKPLIYFVKES